MGRRAQKLNEEFDMVQSVMVGLKLPEEIQMSVINYYENMSLQKFVHNQTVYGYLSKNLTKHVKQF